MELRNKKTTVIGYLVLVGAVADLALSALGAGELNMTEAWGDLVAGAAGVGLINASDGGH